MYYKFKNQNGTEARISISNGNKKLKPTDKVKFIIFNLPAVMTCPYATPSCIKLCYAKKAEIAYPNTKKARARNLEAVTDIPAFIDYMKYIIDKQMNRKTFKAAQAVYFRIHESGDFFSADYLNAWLEIIDYSKKYKNLFFAAYTKSIDFLTMTASYYKKQYPNLNINISIWHDSPRDLVYRAHAEKWDIYTAASAADMVELLKQPAYKKCRCADCGSCKMCLKQHKTQFIKICEIH